MCRFTAEMDDVGFGDASLATGEINGLYSRSFPARANESLLSRFRPALLDLSRGSNGKSLTCMAVDELTGVIRHPELWRVKTMQYLVHVKI